MLVQSIMQRQVITVLPETSLKEVGRLIFGNRINALPVVSSQKKLLGIVTDKDVLKRLYPSYSDYMDDYVHARNFTAMEEKAREVMALSARDVMRKDLLIISPDTPILKAASYMVVKRVNQLPVVQDNNLVGIISHGDIFRSLVAKDLPFWRKTELYHRFAHHYDILMQWEKRVPKELPFILKELSSGKAKSVLDIGCGTGEHALALAKEGYKITGLDISAEMIDIAKEKLAAQSKTLSSRLEFILASMGEIRVKIAKKFDAAICLGNVLPHSLNLTADLADISGSVKPGGLIIFQMRNYDKIIKNGSRFLDMDFRPRDELIVKELAFVRFIDRRPDGYLNFNILTLAREDKGWKSWGVESALQFPLTQALLSENLQNSGFTKLKFFGGFDNSPFRSDKSPELVVIAIKR